MKRIYVTTIPLQGFRDLAKNTYRSAANSGDIETRFPILQVLHNTLQEGDDFHIIAIRSVNGDTQRNFGYLKEELQAMGFTEDHIRELPMPDEQDCSTLIRLCRDLCDVLPEKGIAYMDITYGTKTFPLVQLAALTCAAATHEELEVGGVYYGEMRRVNGQSVDQSILHDVTPLYHLQGLVGGIHGNKETAEMVYNQLVWMSQNKAEQ